MMFRGTYILATRLHQEMLDAKEEDEIDALIAPVREMQDELIGA